MAHISRHDGKLFRKDHVHFREQISGSVSLENVRYFSNVEFPTEEILAHTKVVPAPSLQYYNQTNRITMRILFRYYRCGSSVFCLTEPSYGHAAKGYSVQFVSLFSARSKPSKLT